MADLNKFIRSKERIIDILNHLAHKNAKDESTHIYINDLKKSINVIDDKIEEFKRLHGYIERMG